MKKISRGMVMTSEFSDALASAQWDYANDPATAKVRKESDDFLGAYWALCDKVAGYKNRATPTVSDFKVQNEELEKYQSQLDAMEKELCWRRGDYPDRGAFPRPESMEGNVPPQQCAAPATNPSGTLLKGNKWDEHANRRLLIEMNLPGATQATLAKQYGVSRQAIAKQIKKAEDSLLSRRKAGSFDTLLTPWLKK
jgi:hypothetical protein